MTSPVLSSLEDGILTLQLNNPEVRNAMSQPMGEVLKRELRDAAQDPGMRVVILTGVGDAFCAGADVSMPGMIEAYDSPLEVVKTRLDHLEVVYVMKPCTVPNFRFLPRQNIRVVRANAFQEGLDAKIEGGAYPPVVHPLVFAQPETGRKVLNLSPLFADSILGMDRAESDALLEWLANHITDEARAYDHIWQEGDMVLWDNWRMLHCARGVPEGKYREVHRTSIAGDYALGRVLQAELTGGQRST